jgi:hypothetical protein
MKTEERVSQEDLNNEMKKREREEYYEDKLLELKMQKFLDNYLTEHELAKYKNKLSELNTEKESLLNEKEDLSKKILQIEKEKANNENTLKDLDEKISQAENIQKNIDSEIASKQEYLNNMKNEENLVNYIIKNFSDEFKKEIYEICSKKVNEALKNKNTGKNSKIDKNISNNNDSKFTMVSGQREEFIHNSQNIPFQNNNNSNEQKPTYNPSPFYFPINNQFMYPMMMPTMPNMTNMPNMPNNMPGYPNPYFFVPMPINPNIQQNKENQNNNKNK